MKLLQIEFTHQGKPCGSFRIRSIEEKIGGKLPEDYKKFIKTTGGGTLSLKNTTLAGISLPDGDELEINRSTLNRFSATALPRMMTMT